jgi:predicted small secreted protein
MNKRVRSIFALMILAIGTLVFTGCNTTRGAGEDIESVGEKIQDTTR